MSRRYKLPNHITTINVHRYLREWKKLAAPIVKAFQGELAAFDPGIAISYGPGGRGYLSLSNFQAKVLAEALTAKEQK